MKKLIKLFKEIKEFYSSEEYQKAYYESIKQMQRYGYRSGCHC